MKSPLFLPRAIMTIGMIFFFSSSYCASNCLAQCGTLNNSLCYDWNHIWTQTYNLTTTCSWTLTPNQSWLHASPSSGTGNATITLTIDNNPNNATRTGTFTWGGGITGAISITQNSSSSFTRNPPSASFGTTGGNGSVSASGACNYASYSNASWITITSGHNYNGAATITYTVAPNTGAARTGTIEIAGNLHTVTQSGCTYTISPTSNTTVGAGGTSATIAVTASGSNCPWTAAVSSGSSFITITSGASGTGNGTVGYSVAPNTGPGRSGVIAVAGQTFNITQAGCTYAISPTSNTTVSTGGTTATISVTPNGGSCQWTAQVTSGSNFIHITAGASGTGNGTVSYTVDANTGPSRTGVITVAGQSFNITQAGCTYSISPTNRSVGPAAITGSISVTPNGGSCQWTAQVTSGSNFIHITGGVSGTGSGTVTYSVDANTGATRQGSIDIAGQTFTLIQTGCTYTISPTSNSVGIGATAGTINVTTSSGCLWSAVVTSGSNFLHITGGASGTGNGTVSYAVDANPSGSATRQGTITVAGQIFTLTQAGNIDIRADLAVFITTSAQTVASGEQVSYTIDVRNAGPNSADSVAVTFSMPNGTTFSDQTGASPGGFPAVGRSGEIVAPFGSLSSGQSVRFTVRVNVLAAPGVMLQSRAQVTTTSIDSNPANNTTVSSVIMVQGGGNIDLLFIAPPLPTDADPTPGVRGLEVRPATVTTSGSQSISESAVGELTCPPNSTQSTLLGYRIYISSQSPVLTIDANLYKELTPAEMLRDPIGKLFTGAPLAPRGSNYAVTTLYCVNGQKVEKGRTDDPGSSDPPNQVGAPAGPTLDSVVLKGSKLKIFGSGFSDSVEVFINGKSFLKRAKPIDGGLLQKGGLNTGESLSDLLISGRQLLVSVKNSNGGIGSFTYTVR